MGVKQCKLSISHVNVPENDITTSIKLNTVPDVLEYFASTIPEKEAIIFVSTDGQREVVTFRELYKKSMRIAKALVHLGVRPREIVVLNLRSCPEWLYVTFGSMMAGACPMGISCTDKDGEDLIRMMGKLQYSSCLVFDPGHGNETWNILSQFIDTYSSNGSVTSRQIPSLRHLLCHETNSTTQFNGIKTVSQLFETDISDVSLPEIKLYDEAILFQTSGSTGTPKAVVHTHSSLLKSFKSVEQGVVFSSRDRYFSDRPMNWIGGFPFNLLIGQTRVTVSGFCDEPRDRTAFLIETVRRESCQILLGMPSLLYELLERQGELGENWPIKTVVTGGQPIIQRTVSCIGIVCKYLVILYGPTESPFCYAAAVTDPDEFVDSFCGYPLMGKEVKLVDTDDKTTPINTRGEIYIRSSGGFRQYINDAEKTREVLTEDGWFKTDDIAVMMEDGSLRIEGRKSNMISLSGEINVAPELLERLIQKCPGVHSAILVPVPDDDVGLVVCACVTTIPGRKIDEEYIRKFCEEARADRCGLLTVLPKYYMILESFPETTTGKTSRSEIAKMAREQFLKT